MEKFYTKRWVCPKCGVKYSGFDDFGKSPCPVCKNKAEIKELKEKQIHWATLENVTACRLGIENIEKILQELIAVYEMENMVDTGLLNKLGGEKPVEDIRVFEKGTPQQTDSKPPSYENFLMIHNFEMIGTDGTCKKCGADFQKARYTPCNPSEQDTSHSKPPSCEFCGRDLILYKEKWICGHGCTKPAINPSEQGALSSEGWTKDKFPEWKLKEKEPTRQTDFDLGEFNEFAFKLAMPPKQCNDCMIGNWKSYDCLSCNRENDRIIRKEL
ncbi:hypothetical protein LCGC14_0987770 [marine sediment metagenome]|uniref:Rubredoxin-like domain-containing protein n=1 Tax=marine sediment metagenome TaxID=412755 RepID=A0A0F9RDB3_9ZZZZ